MQPENDGGVGNQGERCQASVHTEDPVVVVSFEGTSVPATEATEVIGDVMPHLSYIDQGGSLLDRAVVVQALGYGNRLDLMFDGNPLDYILFINDFC